MLGHEDVAVDLEVVTLAGFFEGLLEEGVVTGEVGFAAITAEGDEVKVALGLVTPEA